MLIYLYSKNILRVFHRKRKAYMPLPKPAACWAQKETNKRNLDCFSEENDSGSKSGNGNGHGNGHGNSYNSYCGIVLWYYVCCSRIQPRKGFHGIHRALTRSITIIATLTLINPVTI